MKKLAERFEIDAVWTKVIVFSSVLFFIRFADSIIAFWAPNQIQNTLNNPVFMGIIISFQSVVGVVADLVFPRLLKSASVRKLVFWAILASALTSLFLSSSVVKPFLAIFVVTMALWGIYYELISFANFQFMGSAVPAHRRSGAWGIFGIFVSLAYFFGPLVAAQLLMKGYLITQGAIVVFLFFAWVLLVITKSFHDTAPVADLTKLNPITEIKHWLTLSEHIWPVLIISLLLGFVDSTFWTVGAVWTEKLAQTNPWGGWLLSFYLLPFILIGLPVARMGIEVGKKKLAEKYLGIAGIMFILMAVNENLGWQIAMVAAASSALAVCYPMLEGVYSDIIARMRQEKKEMIGLTSSVTNISYIIWPVVAGLISSMVGPRLTFSYLGGLIVIVSVILLLVTPRKLKLPQEEIKTWH